MPQVNGVYKIVTPGMDAAAAGLVKISGKANDPNQKISLEIDLVSKGWRYLQNDVKNFLKEARNESASDKKIKTNIPEERISNLVELCMEFTEINQSYDRELLRSSLTRALSWDPKENAYNYKAPAVKGTGNLIKESIDKAFFEGKSNLKNNDDNSRYRNYHRQLFTPEPSDESRKVILQFAYLMKMTREEATTYLTKWSFSDDFRWEDPWELAAAYWIERFPAREEDRAGTFLEAVKDCTERKETDPDSPENLDFLDYIREKELQEYDKWVCSYHEHCQRNLRDEFLCHWSWLLLAAKHRKTAAEEHSRAAQEDPRKQKIFRVVPDMKTEDLQQALPVLCHRLNTYICCHVDSNRPLSAENEALRQQIIQTMKDRHLRLCAAAYVYGCLDYVQTGSNSTDPHGPCTVLLQIPGRDIFYVPPHRDLGFRAIPISAQKTVNILRQTKETIPDGGANKTAYVPNRPTRSDVIRLGIEFALTGEGINHLLSIGGFYQLYSRDFFEFTLKKVLHAQEDSFFMDGCRFGVKTCGALRSDDDVEAVRKALKEEYLQLLDENYDSLTKENREIFSQDEPGWVKKSIRRTDCE